MTRKKLIAGLLLVVLALAIVTLIARPPSIPSVMDIYGCSETFSQYHVDPDVARQNVPSKWQVKIHSNGQALLLVMVQECDKMVLDNVIDVGPVGMSHVWIELEGPQEVVTPLPGITRSLPTRYWFIAPHQLDNRLARILFGLVGVDAQFVEKVSLGGDPGGARSGEVIERDAPEAKYTWTETSQLYAAPDIVTGSQRFYRKYGVRESEAYGKCESHFLGDAQVSLSATTDSVVGKLGFGPSLTGFSNPVWVKHCRVDYRVDFF
ncbi:MAG TPA: hypothetical protein VM075_05605 [Anaerolineae bacterium]|nr:hypothetical protein [Anaerolineae bacterium]